ncbi:hypothetical protein TSAR_011028 [Trichomalopsis sarcophagae]|uniref:Ionotropic glutamate receptor C-terminal domain-containing protein n=1 Tax=Trichomalopsis sarcophagae TaxID=543379 RepID=A0A232FKV4_9HYME|nr:hypothetical protein TSAR_011028 [Trichomalopsis sarcophagae]
MNISLAYFSIIFLNLLLASLVKSERSLAGFVLAITSRYQTLSYIISMSDTSDFTENSYRALEYTRVLSDKYVYSMIIQIDELDEAIDRYYHKIVKPTYIIIIESHDDFDKFVNFTNARPQERPVNSHVWLVIFRTNNKFLLDICEKPVKNYFNLVFNVKMMVACNNPDSSGALLIREWYSLFPDKTQLIDYAIWDAENFTKLSDLGFYERRSLEGVPIRTTRIKSATPGYVNDLLELMVNVSHFERVRQEPEHFYGHYDPVSKKWNGIIEKLTNNETDIGVGEFAMTDDRLDVVDFSLPILVLPSKYYIKKPNENVLHWSIFFIITNRILTSYLTIFKHSLPFNSIDEFIKDGTYKIAVVKDTNYYDYFNGCKREKTVVLLEDFTLNSNHIKLGCELVSFDEASLLSLSIAYRKHSPYTYYFNVFLQKMQSYGLLQILRRRNDRVNYNLEDNYEPVTVYSVLPIFALLACARWTSPATSALPRTTKTSHRGRKKESSIQLAFPTRES